jgi:hypothetical protein
MAKRPRPARQASPKRLAETAAATSAPRRSARLQQEGGRLVYNVHDFLANKLGTEVVGGPIRPALYFPTRASCAPGSAFRVLTAKGLIVSHQGRHAGAAQGRLEYA